MLIDWSLVLTIGFIFLVTLTGAWLRSRRKDPCLAAFEGYHVTLEHADGRVIWGALKVQPTGLELIYRQAVQDEEHVEASYVLYENEFEHIQAIYRYADVLDEASARRRAKDLQRWFHPGPMRYLLRKMRNFLSTASSSMNEVVGLVVGRARKPVGRYLTDTGEVYLRKFSGDLIGQAGLASDPLLEQFIGRRVVVELGEEGEVHEHVGILKNYSQDFLELLDVKYPFKQLVPVEPLCTVHTDRITAVERNKAITINNHCDYPVLVQSLHVGGEEKAYFDVLIDPGEEATVRTEQSFPSAELRLKVVRELDWVVPRTHCLIRHRATQIEPGRLPDIVFDMGVMLRAGDRERAREERLRSQLQLDARNALAAANLGGLLLQREEYDEAEKWLQTALEIKDSLPDRGRRAEMQLRELKRKRPRVVAPPANEFDHRLVRPDAVVPASSPAPAAETTADVMSAPMRVGG